MPRIIFALLVFAQCSFPQSPTAGIAIGNFGQVNATYYRGAQPDAAGCLALKSIGIRTVVDLRKDNKREAAAWVRNAGMHYIHIPLSNSRPPTAEQTAYFLEILDDPAHWPVFVHCAGGKHRTGVMTAVYRIARDSWTADQAFEEMKRYGFYSFPNHGSLKKFVYQFYQNSLKR